MTRQSKFLFFIAIIAALPIAGYLVTYFMTITSPLEQQGSIYHGVLALVVTLLLLLVPYGIFKFMAMAAHTRDPDEEVPQLRDIPKDKEQWEHTQKS